MEFRLKEGEIERALCRKDEGNNFSHSDVRCEM